MGKNLEDSILRLVDKNVIHKGLYYNSMYIFSMHVDVHIIDKNHKI